MLTYAPNSGLFSYTSSGETRCRCIILSNDTPSSLEVTGADVEGLEDDVIIAAGTVMIAPLAYYIALEDGVFTLKG